MEKTTRKIVIAGSLLGMVGVAYGIYKKDVKSTIKFGLSGLVIGSLSGYLFIKIKDNINNNNINDNIHYASGDISLKDVGYKECNDIGGWWLRGKCYKTK